MHHIVKICDKEFSLFIEKENIEKTIYNLSKQLNKELRGKKPIFIIVLKGAFFFGADLLKHLNIECEIDFISLSSYQGTTSSQIIKEVFKFNVKVKDRTVVIIEDIVDTGITMRYLIDKLKEEEAKEIKIVTLLFKPLCFKENFIIDYIGFSIPNDFVIGYGLDYNEYGRNLKNIYKLVSGQ